MDECSSQSQAEGRVIDSQGTTDGGPHHGVGVIVVAAGGSQRMGGVDKIFAPLNGWPLVSYCLAALHHTLEVDGIVLVLSSRNIEQGRRLVQEYGWGKVLEVCEGGERRRDSVAVGLSRLPDSGWIVVHDGARPFVDAALVSRGLNEARETGAAVAGVPVSDTIKLADGERFVKETLRREGLWAIQTPQVFRRQLLAKAHDMLTGEFTDDAAMVEQVGARVRIYSGSSDNIKVTTPDDLRIAEALLDARKSPRPAHQP